MDKKIENILTPCEINTINERIAAGVSVFTVSVTYQSFSNKDREIIKCYIKERFELVFNNTKMIGHKNEPYYKTEDEMIIPKYTWNDLSNQEKQFHKQKNK